MNRNSADLIIFLSLVLLTAAILLFAVTQTSIEIQLHDTYLVLDRMTLAVLILGPMTILIFLPLAAMRKFKSMGTNIALVFGLMLVAVICYSVAELQSSYIGQLNSLDEIGPGDKAGYYNATQSINIIRGILAVIGLSALVLIYRTVKIWKEAHSRPSL
ncbi:MAG TPA: hypothetical protein VIU13_13045 [Chryseolinea sp.]